jgi:hypothetical protein
VPVFRDSYTWVELVLFDTKTGAIAWSSDYWRSDDSENALVLTMGDAVGLFPAHEGRKARYPRSRPRR